MNITVISGNIVRDAQVLSAGGDRVVVDFTVAVNDRVKNRSTGQWEDRPSFIDCSRWVDPSSKLPSILLKGRKVTVLGKLRQETWEKDGQKHSKLKILADSIEVGQQPMQEQPEAPKSYSPAYDAGLQAAVNRMFAPGQVQDDYYSEDIPF